MDALRRFGAPVTDLTTDDLVDADTVYQIGLEPNRIDILNAVSGLEFAKPGNVAFWWTSEMM